MKKATSAAERKHMARVAEMTCAACGVPGVHVHHIREGQGMSQRAGNYLVIPLCPECHMGDFSIHKSKKQFEAIYGTELDMLNRTIGRLS